MGADSDESQNRLADVPQFLDNNRGVRKMKGMHFKSEIAQRQLSDLGREVHAKRTLSAL